MAISSIGLGSGLDVEDMVAKLVALEQKPIQALQIKATAINSQVSAFSQLKSQISNLQTQVDKLTASETWQGRVLSSANSSTVSGTATSKAAFATYDVKVQQLASAQTIGSGLVPTGTALGQGKLTITLGEWKDGALKPNEVDGLPASVSIDITAEDDTLAKVAAKINAANAGVSATVLRDHTGERLSLQSTATGTNAAFSVAVEETADQPGLKRLEYLGADSSAGMTRSQTAQDTLATINGIAMASRNTTFADVADGVTLTVSQKTEGDAAVRITIKGDTATAKTALTNLVESYNALSSAMSTMTSYDPTSKTAGTLQGDSTAINLQSALRRLLTSNSGAGGAFTTLSQIGLAFQTDGTLKIDDTKLTKALEDPDSMAKFFAADLEGDANDGLGVRLKDFTTGLLSSDGVFATKDESMKSQLKRNTQDQERLTTRVNAYEKRLLAQYTALDVKMSSLTALDTYINQQITMWNKDS
ncbi:flagellar filament capping protein FliD [Comamonas endophytica]|uniref:Flagellar hook-associated protein 2 n=1 Tax=Comamonas endophytica TaxID=2949090 RepID=A0ABY6GDB4_9BURK|nr:MULTISPECIES: flagellar filament capping protein FliD [unclassified Acidovorax]MCD2512741.1 flagellar filament capping protein FliD [Acidovorax sp. D4N7]UYG52908.1 flagellar filament capping protein FliD [Acidovorax sp. 5MLIR]